MKSLVPILFEDADIVAFDKPSGLLVAPDRWDKSRENLMRMVHDRMSPDIFNVHRLDADTSGVLLCSKNKKTLDRLCQLFESHKVEKNYLAIVQNGPKDDTGSIRKPLVADERHPGRMRVSGTGKPAETLYEIVERWREYALVKLRPMTGRTHQLRVHMAFFGCPIVSDPLYGDGNGLFLSQIKPHYKKTARPERPLIGRLALHAEKLTFQHPDTGQNLAVISSLPKDFEIALKYLRRFG